MCYPYMEEKELNEPFSAIREIRCAFNHGTHLTTLSGNRIGHTVDFRKIVSVLRTQGMNIKDYWCEDADSHKRFKMYYLATE